VAHLSPAERQLIERGAIHIGMVDFDPPTVGTGALGQPFIRVGATAPGPGWGSSRN
jgi:hypothetical protein